jgi:hypothetical protein
MSGGNNVPIKHWDARQPRSDTWYYFSLKRTANGDTYAKLWERDKPDSSMEFHGNLDSEWSALEVAFFADYRTGSFFLDEYQDLQ